MKGLIYDFDQALICRLIRLRCCVNVTLRRSLQLILLIYSLNGSNVSNILKTLGIFLDTGTSSRLGLIVAPSQEANGNNLGMSFRSSIK